MHRIRAAVDIDITAHRVDLAQPIETDLAAGQPQNPRQDPVPFSKLLRQHRGVNFTSRTASDKYGVLRKARADSCADDMRAQGCAVATG